VLATQIRQKRHLLLWQRPAPSCSPSPFHQPFLRRRRRDRRRASPRKTRSPVHRQDRAQRRAFQRTLSRAKVRQLKNFYETAITQPPIPERYCCSPPRSCASSLSRARRARPSVRAAGEIPHHRRQHRLAALRFYLDEHRTMPRPSMCVRDFDGGARTLPPRCS